MYQEHKDIETPSDDTIIWRLMSCDKFKDLVETQELHLSPLGAFDDKYEGHWPDLMLAIADASGDDLYARSMHGTADDAQSKVFACCWREDETGQDLPWQEYNKVSCAVQSTIGRLKNTIPSDERHLLGRVKYKDFKGLSLVRENILSLSYIKRQKQAWEKEIRLAYWHTSSEPPPKSVRVPVNPSELLEAVLIAPTAEANCIEQINELLSKHEYNDVNVQQASV